jgi:hypothetical protein
LRPAQRLGDHQLGSGKPLPALLLAEPKVDRHGGDAGEHASVHRDYELLARGKRQRNPRTCCRPLERVGRRERCRRELGIGQAPLWSLDRNALWVLGGGQVKPERHTTKVV